MAFSLLQEVQQGFLFVFHLSVNDGSHQLVQRLPDGGTLKSQRQKISALDCQGCPIEPARREAS